MKFLNYDYISNLLVEHTTYVSNVKHNYIDPTMFVYINNIRKNDIVLNLSYCVKSTVSFLKLISAGVKNKNKFLFVGNNKDVFINKLIKLTAEKAGQDFYDFSSKKLSHTKLLDDLSSYNADFIIILYPKNILPVLKSAQKLSIPVIGLCDLNIKSEFFVQFIPTNLSYKSIHLFSNLLLKAFKQL